ncbi:MAG: NADP-dependent phosphogluconate dehydrogenase, partial [Hymenobacteraceae bacterium]|nr:NADP-dependent phosphogluconate dehydrogenase [Hymenobacteraceae bacterium]
PADLIIDGGNSHYVDTDRRVKALAEKGLRFVGVGVSGGELGARFGPAMMPGGDPSAWEVLRPIFEAIAAKAPDGQPCVAYMGAGPAGHYVKMAHNGIEYGVMQLLAEGYDLLRRGLGLSVAEVAAEFEKWDATPELQSFLVQITAIVLRQPDDRDSTRPLIDAIRDRARSKGTGKWTSQSAMDLQVPLFTVDAAVGARDISARDEERRAAAALLPGPALTATLSAPDARAEVLAALPQALYCALVTCYAQGLDLLRVAAKEYGYGTDLATVARVWRAGCIIRAALLEEITAAYKANPTLPNILVDPTIGGHVVSRQTAFRTIAHVFIRAGIPAPALLNSLAYFDSYRTARLPANLTQAQRDYFGAHTYERLDADGTFHTLWSEISTAQGSSSSQEKRPGSEQTVPV